MKKIIALIAFVLISGCEQSTDTDNELTLPPVTTEGKDILACKIDGEIYIAKGLGGGYGMSFGEDDGVVIISGDPIDWIRSIRSIPKRKDDEFSDLEIYVPTTASVNDTVILSDIYQGKYTKYIPGVSAFDKYHTDDYHKGKVIILWRDSKVISGTFEFDAYSPETGKIVHVTEGRFDIRRWY